MLMASLPCGPPSLRSEPALLQYLGTARGPAGSPLYDPVAALAVVKGHGRPKARCYSWAPVYMAVGPAWRQEIHT